MRPPKRCPFCGDRPNKKLTTDAAKMNHTLIACENELCDIQPCAIDMDETKALQKWNRRAE